MPYSDFYARVGEAAEAGAPIGASVNIAQVSQTAAQAAAAGGVMSRAGASFYKPTPRTGTPEPAKAPTFWDHVGRLASGAGHAIVRGLEFGVEATGNFAEALIRTERQVWRGEDVDPIAHFTSLPFLAPLSSTWRENWEKAVDAEASVGQTLWLVGEELLGNQDRPGAGGVVSGGLDLLDNPDRWGERQEYFSLGAARWTTGVIDALWQVYADPLIVGGKAAGVAKAAHRTLSADDVAKVADRSLEAAELSWKQRRARNLVDELVEGVVDATSPGAAASAANRMRWLRESPDGEAIAYMLSRVHDIPGLDRAGKLEAARDILYAGMGEAGALARVRARSQLLDVELRKLTNPDGLIPPVLMTPGLDDATAVRQWWSHLNDTDLAAREISAQKALIRRELDALQRLEKVGAPVEGVGRQVGALARTGSAREVSRATSRMTGETVLGAASARDIVTLVKTIKNGRYLDSISFLTGRHLPGTFKLSDDDAPDVFREAVRRAQGILRRSDERYAEFKARLDKLEQDFIAPGAGPSSKVPRGDVVRQFDDLVDEMIAHKYNVDKDQLSAVYQRMRGRRAEELQEVSRRWYKAKQAGDPQVIRDESGILVYAGDGKFVDELGAGTPVARTQLEDWVSIIDPKRLDDFAHTHFRDGMAGFVREVRTGGFTDGRVYAAARDAADPARIRASSKWEASAEILAAGNRLWKFAALLRPWGYFVRNQIDAQARNLALLSSLKGWANLARGARNTLYNMRRVDRAELTAKTEMFELRGRIEGVQTRLAFRGVDPENPGLSVNQRARGLESRLSELQQQRKGLRFNEQRHEPGVARARIAKLDEQIARMEARGGKQKSLPELRARRERLARGMEAWEEARRLDDEIRELSDQVATVRSTASTEVDDLLDELEALRRRLDEVADWEPTGEKVRRRGTLLARHIGMGDRVKDAYRTPFDVQEALSRMNGEDAHLGIMFNGTRRAEHALRSSGHWDPIRPQDPNWAESWERAVNRQVRNDALGRRILAGWSDDEIMAWFRDTPEGRAYLRDMLSSGSETADLVVGRLREHVEALLPDEASKAVALERPVTKDDIAGLWPDVHARPIVPGEILQPNWQSALARGYKTLEKNYFHWFGSLPENMMARHPLYAERFANHAQRLMDNAGITDEAMLTLDQVNEIRRQAAKMARQDVARYAFDTSKQSNVGHMLRFVSPFYGAWEDTMVKWARIFGDKPETIGKFWNVVRSPNAAGLVVDQDGNPVDAMGNVRDPKTGEVIGSEGIWGGYVIIPLPDWAKDIPVIGQAATGAKSLRIAKNAANVVFQGDPWFLPGPGPVLAVPTNELIVKMFPEAYGEDGSENPILKYILPLGPTSDPVLEQVMPAWARAAKDALTMDGRRVNHVFTQLYQEQLHAEMNGETDQLSNAKRIEVVQKRTRNWMILRLMGTQMPFTWTPESRLSFYKSEYDRFRREYGAEADDKFRAEYPEYFLMAISLSANETGLAASDDSWGAVQRYRNDIAQHPEYGWFWAGAANLTGGFSQGVYHAQMRQTIAPGTSKTFRSRKDPLEAARDAQVAQGWHVYQQVNTVLQLKLEERGLDSFQQAGAQDLADIKQRFIAELQRQNPAWAFDFNEGSGSAGRVPNFLSLALEQHRAHPELLERQDQQLLRAYIELRETIRAKMAERGLKSINAEGNADLKQIWDRATAQMVATDIGFEQMWNRVLERDDLTGDIFVGG